MRASSRPRRAFTLIEVLIVVVILAIVATVTIPMFVGNFRAQAAETALTINLGMMREAIHRYAAEHHGMFPARLPDGTHAAGTEDCFRRQLLLPTDDDGKVLDSPEAPGARGPFLNYQIPPCHVGRLAGQRSVKVVDETGRLTADAEPTHVWKYNLRTGELICNSPELSTTGVPYQAY